jgi:hypothetical protein
MDRTQVRDKSADDVEIVDMTGCPLCGGPRSEWGCRRTIKGDFCLQHGLREDPRRIIGPAPDPLKPLIEQDRAVRKALAEFERLTAAADREVDKWEQIALEHLEAVRLNREHRQEVVVDGRLIAWVPANVPTLPEIRQLEERAAQAMIVRQHAAEQAIKARQALDGARARARARLERQAS